MSDESAATDFEFDVFISYSRKDSAFARRLEQTLKAYAPPRDLPAPQRTLRVFRDESDFVGTEYNRAVRSNLQAARKLLVVCSPNAAQSRYVNEEIRLFSELRGPENIVIVLLAGLPNNEAAMAQGQDEAFPASLVAALPTPLANDYRGIDPQRDRLDRHRFENAWFKTLADLFADYGISRAQIEQREKLRQARRRRVIAAITGAVMIILAALTIWALFSRQEAIRQGRLFKSSALASQSINRIEEGFDLRSLLAVEAYTTAPTPQAWEALLLAMEREPHIVKVQPGHDQEITALAFSADGRLVASADKTRVLIWPVGPGSATQVVAGGAATSALTFSRDGQDLVTGHVDGVVRVWNLRGKPALRLSLGSPGRAATNIATAAGDILVAGYEDGSVRGFHLATGGEIGPPARPQKTIPIATLRVSKDGSEFAVITRDGRLSRGRILEGRVVFDLLAGDGSMSDEAAISADLDLYATGGFGPDLTLSNARTGERIAEFPSVGGYVLALAFRPGSSQFAIGRDGGKIALGDTETHRYQSTTFEDHTTDITALAYSGNGTWLASGSRDGRIVLWSAQPIDRILTREDVGPSNATAWAAGVDTGDIVAGTKTGGVEFSTLHARRARRAVTGKHGDGVSAVAVADQGGRAASGDRSGHVLLWDVQRAEVLAELPPRSSQILALRFSRNAARLLVLESSNLLTLWDVTVQPPSLLLESKVPAVQEPMPTLPIAFSPGGDLVVLGGADRTVRVWTVSGKAAKLQALTAQPLSYISSVAVDPAGETIAMGGGLDDGGVMVWDLVRNGLKYRRLGGPNPMDVTALAFSSDGKQLASAHSDGVVSLWDMDTGRLIGEPFRVPAAGPIVQLGFAASGNQLVGLPQDGKALVWNLDPAAWMKIACSVANRPFSDSEKRTILLGANSDTCANKSAAEHP